MSARQATRFLLHVASRGGNLLLNVGPDASGHIPPVQRRCLEGMGEWTRVHGSIDGTRRVDAKLVKPAGEAGDEDIGKKWVRWLKRGRDIFAYIDSNESSGQVTLQADWKMIDRSSAQNGGKAFEVGEDGAVDLANLTGPMPSCIKFRLSDA
jgi:alpha-L-fucosidase